MCENKCQMQTSSSLNMEQTTQPVTLNLNESDIRRLRLNECIKYIYINRGKIREVSTKLEVNEFATERLTKSVEAALKQKLTRIIKSPIERARRRLFRITRKTRKSQRPQKSTDKGRLINFKMYSTNCKPLHKVRRGYLKEARKIVEHELRWRYERTQYREDAHSFEQLSQRFYQEAHELMTDMLKSRYRVQCALYEYYKKTALRQRFYLNLMEEYVGL